MGKRGRERIRQASEAAVAPRDRMARVHVSDEVWAEFRAGLRGGSVSEGLGRMVENTVKRGRRQTAGSPEEAQLAIKDARAMIQDLERVVARLEGKQTSASSISARDGHWR